MEGTNFSGYKRLTTRYNTGWKELDTHEYLGEFRVLKVRSREADDYSQQYGEKGTQTITVRAPRGVSKDDVKAALVNEFSNSCRCEHDCCGCLITRAGTPRHVRRRQWVVPVSLSINI